ncbi:MAG: DUF4139 domain-containing protein [Phycisphaeraceae bacterium]|nr:DUF4139 domain-containing protein [Phycisphaeraceae bacterium]
MKTLRNRIAGGLALSLLAGSALAQDKAQGPVVTIYSTLNPGQGVPRDALAQARYSGGWSNISNIVQGFATVRQYVTLDLKNGLNDVRVTDVAALIEPTTVSFQSLTAPNTTRVLEQNFQFDLIGREKLLEKYVDREIKVGSPAGDSVSFTSGTLLSTAGGIVLRDKGGQIQIVGNATSFELPTLPQGLLTRPTLLWQVETQQPGTHTARITYETEGMTWWADYNALFAPGKDNNSGTLDLSAWVSIVNQSGASYPEATLKLIAGRVNRIQPQQNAYGGRRELSAMADRADGFEQKAFFEYHLYTLGRATTLPDNSTKQIELFPAVLKIPCEKTLVYDGLAMEIGDWGGPMTDQGFGSQGRTTVDVYLRFQNSKASGLGIPMPAGRVRVSQVDAGKNGQPADAIAEFIGEDVLKHTPKDESVLLKLGAAFDVVGERKQVDFKVDSNRRTMEETIEISVRNHKDIKTNVIVRERLYRWANWEISGATEKYEKTDSRTIQFPLTLEPGKEGKVRYTVKYSW